MGIEERETWSKPWVIPEVYKDKKCLSLAEFILGILLQGCLRMHGAEDGQGLARVCLKFSLCATRTVSPRVMAYPAERESHFTSLFPSPKGRHILTVHQIPFDWKSSISL